MVTLEKDLISNNLAIYFFCIYFFYLSFLFHFLNFSILSLFQGDQNMEELLEALRYHPNVLDKDSHLANLLSLFAQEGYVGCIWQ